jgi:hypothetical protein
MAPNSLNCTKEKNPSREGKKLDYASISAEMLEELPTVVGILYIVGYDLSVKVKRVISTRFDVFPPVGQKGFEELLIRRKPDFQKIFL